MMKQRKRNQRRSTGGYTLAETLIAIALIALLSTGVAAGAAFGVRQYNISMSRSEARILASTLTSILRDEFTNVSSIDMGGGTLKYYSPHFTQKNADTSDLPQSAMSWLEIRDGKLGLTAKKFGGGETHIPLLGDAAYSKSQKLEVTAAEAGWDGSAFQVRLTIHTPLAGDITESFNVIPLNTVTLSS